MPVRTGFSRRWSLAALALLALAVSGCATGRLDATKPVGPNAEKIDGLMRLSGWMAVGVGLFVAAAVVIIIVRFRAKPGDDPDDLPPQIHGNRKAELTWTLIPTALLIFLTVVTLPTVFALAEKGDGRTIIVEGQQWWWQFSYDTDGDGQYDDIVTANDLVIPVGEEVNLEIRSNDVIHSFWIPRLNGKKDAVPGRVHDWRISSNEAGIFYGECTEFCGLSHANMQMRTIALEPDDFDRWVAEQEAQIKAASVPAEGTPEAAGYDLFGTHCISCHVIDGVYESAAGGNANLIAGIAPNLTNLMSRTAFAGALFDTYEADGTTVNVAELREWVRNAPGMKPARADNRQGMLDFSEVLTDDDLDNLLAYLMTLGGPPVLPE